MADIRHQFPVKASLGEVFQAVSTPAGLDAWWTLTSSGEPVEGTEYELGFGPGYDWCAVVKRSRPDEEFELEMVPADEDWRGTRVGFLLEEKEGHVQVRFHHLGWPEENDHYRISSFCWAMYLRLLKRYVERGEIVPYKDRLDA